MVIPENACLMAPSALFTGDHGKETKVAFDKAVEEATESQRAGKIELYPSSVNDRFVCYRFQSALPLYALHGLEEWEKAYDTSPRFLIHGNESGKGAFDPEIGLAWENYPSPVYNRKVSHDGPPSREEIFMREVFGPLFEKAEKYGVIRGRQTAEKKYYYEAILLNVQSYGRTPPEPTLEGYPVNSKSRIFEKGEALLDFIEKSSEGTIAKQIVAIKLDGQGKFSTPNENSAIARDEAMRSLRRHVPLYKAIRQSLRLIQPYADLVDLANEEQMRQRYKLTPVELAACGLLVNRRNTWILPNYPTHGLETAVANINMMALNESERPLHSAGFLMCILAQRYIANASLDKGDLAHRAEVRSRELADEKTAQSVIERLIQAFTPIAEEAKMFYEKYPDTPEGRREFGIAIKDTVRYEEAYYSTKEVYEKTREMQGALAQLKQD